MRKKARGVNSASKIAIRSMKIMISSLVSKVNPSQQRADFAARRGCSVVHPICHNLPNLPICGRYALSSEAARGGMGAKIAGGSTALGCRDGFAVVRNRRSSGRMLTGAGTAFTYGVRSLTARSRSVSKQRNPNPLSLWLLHSLAFSGSGRGQPCTLGPPIGSLLRARRRGESPGWEICLCQTTCARLRSKLGYSA